jgi:hypothetical protein
VACQQCPKPKAIVSTKVGSVKSEVNPQGGGKPSRTPGQLVSLSGARTTLHNFEALQGFNRAQEDAGADARKFTRDIQHIGGPINEVNVSVPALEIEGAIASGGSSKSVPRLIIDYIGFGLDDPSAHPTRGDIMDQNFADEIPGELDRIHWQDAAVKASDKQRG